MAARTRRAPSDHLKLARAAHRNFPMPALVEEAIRRKEVLLVEGGPILALTGQHTGRSPNDKFLVKEPSTEGKIWWGKVNVPLAEKGFESLLRRVEAYLKDKEVYVQDVYAGADPQHRIQVRVITEYAWHSLFARTMFASVDGAAAPAAGGEEAPGGPPFTVIDVPGCRASPEEDGTRSPTCIVVNFAQRLVLIGGTSYAGEIKKSVFTILNYLLPQAGVLSMHAAANMGASGEVAIFFGLSGTGKTTLSADPQRTLIGDDEHGWHDRGVFNFERGCYAKVIRLSREGEPEIYATTRMFGTVLENVVHDPLTRRIDLDSDSITENTRAAYPIHSIPNASATGMGGHPRDVVMLTADAFGILPPIARLNSDQAMYHFLSGYTARLAGTERGVKEPSATFSTCFGAPFLPLHPGVYARLLGERIAAHRSRVWLLNTGWAGGPAGVAGRLPLAATRAMLKAALSGALDAASYRPDPVFRVEVPVECPGVPRELLQPRLAWSDPTRYDSKARELAGRFRENFKQFESELSPAIRAAGPAGE